MFAEFTATDVLKYATPETLTVFGVLIALLLGWKLAKVFFGVVLSGFGLIRKFSFATAAASILALTGLGGVGVGGGELISRMVDGSPKEATTQSTALSESSLVNLASKDKDSVKEVLAYAAVKDKAAKGGNVEMEQLIALVKTATPENKSMITELIKLQQIRDEQKVPTSTLISTETTRHGTASSVDEPKSASLMPLIVSDAPKKNSYFSYQLSIAMILMGIGGCVVAGNIYNNRPLTGHAHMNSNGWNATHR